MPKDTVLRCLILEVIEGKNAPRVIDTIEDGENYVLVLEWAFIPGRESEGEMPKKTVALPKTLFQVIKSHTLPYELLLPEPLNISALNFRDVEVDEDEVWAEPDNLFTPRPNDQ